MGPNLWLESICVDVVHLKKPVSLCGLIQSSPCQHEYAWTMFIKEWLRPIAVIKRTATTCSFIPPSVNPQHASLFVVLIWREFSLQPATQRTLFCRTRFVLQDLRWFHRTFLYFKAGTDKLSCPRAPATHCATCFADSLFFIYQCVCLYFKSPWKLLCKDSCLGCLVISDYNPLHCWGFQGKQEAEYSQLLSGRNRRKFL